MSSRTSSEWLRDFLESFEDAMRKSGEYGARVPVPDGAPAQDRLIGFIGRDPRWSRPV